MKSITNWVSGVYKDATLKINIDEHHGSNTASLMRQMGLFSVILFTITSAVGSGILTTPGIIATQYAGPFAYMSFLKAGMICLCPALCLAYMASKTMKSGSTGSYACLVLGQLPGLLMFVDVMMECIGGTAAVSVSQAEHIKMIYRLIGEQWFKQKWELGDWWTKTPEHVNWPMFFATVVSGIVTAVLLSYSRKLLKTKTDAKTQSRTRTTTIAALAGTAVAGAITGFCTVRFVQELQSINLLSMLVVLTVMVILLRGVKETAILTNLFTLTKLFVLGVIVVYLRKHFDPANLALPVPPELPGSLAGASVAFFAFVGLDLATTTAGEVKNSKRNVPIGMLIGLACVTVLYYLAAYYLTAAVPYYKLSEGKEGDAAPMIRALELLDHKEVAIWVAIGSTIALISVVLASAYATTRLLYNMAQHGLMPAAFEKLSPKRQVPVFSTLVVCIGISMLTALMQVKELMHLTNIGTMTAFITISLTVLVLTIRETEWRTARGALKGTFWVLIALGGIAGPARLLMELPWEAFARLVVVWSAVLILFVTYSRHHSLARKQQEANPDAK